MTTTTGGAPAGDHTPRCLLMFPATLTCTCVDEVNRKLATLAIALIAAEGDLKRLYDRAADQCDVSLGDLQHASRVRRDAHASLRAAVHNLNQVQP